MKNMNNERNLKEKRNNKRKTNNKYSRYYTSYYDEDYYGSRTLDDYEVRNIKVVEIW